MTPTAFDAVVERLRHAGCVFAEDEARLLLDEAVDASRLESLVARRVSGEPLEYILGWAAFAGLRVPVAPGVFVPRLRSTLLVREALRVGGDRPVVLDLCCGSGAIGAAILAARAGATIYACDIDPVATHCARRALGPAALVLTGDLYAPLPTALHGRIEVIVANAPYVPTDDIRLMPSEARDHEARSALDGGPDGLQLQRRLVRGAPEWLTPGGRLLIETSRRQAAATAGILEAAGFSSSVVHDDDVGGTVAIGGLDGRHRAPGSSALYNE